MSRKLYLALALVLALAGMQVHALGLGGMRLQSALDQPFVGEIDLVDVKPDELDSVKVQIAPQAEFSRTGTERYHHLTKLRFSAQISPRGNPVIRVSSREPMREPYMDFLVEAVWPAGRLVKQYTLLLDPPVTASRSAPRIEQPIVEARPARAAAPGVPAVAPVSAAATAPQAPPPAARPARIAAPPSAPVPIPAPAQVRVPPGAGGDFPRYLGPIRPGTGLWRLARANTPPGATVSQTAMALYRNNQHAFVNGDINRLIVGQDLSIPHAGELFALSPEAAQQEFQAALRGNKVRRSPLTDPNTPVGSPGEAGSRLRIAGAPADTGQRGATPPEPPGAGAQSMEREILLARETSESARQETVEMRGRIRDLEARLAEIQQLLKLRNEELARVQGGVGSGSGVAPAVAPDGVPAAVPAAIPTAPRVAEARPVQPPETAPPDLKGAVGVAGGLPPDEGAVLPPAEPPAAQPPVPPVAATPEPQPDARPLAAVPQSKPGAPVVGSAKVPVVEPPSGDSTWRALLLPLAGVAGVTALGIGVLTWLRSRRRVGRDSSVEFDSSDLADDPVTRTNRDLAAAPAAPAAPRTAAAPPPLDSDEILAVDTPSSAFATFGRADPETDEADAISEADIYIAYGRYREAEDLLREEIRRTPARLDLKFKLAEAYYGAKNTEALQALMQEMRAAGGDRSNPDQWQRLVDMAAGTQSEVAQGGVVVPSMRPPSSGMVAAALARAPALGGGTRAALGSDILVESIEPNSADVYTLDISDAQKPSADLALQGMSNDARPPRAAAVPPGRPAPTNTPISTPISIEPPPEFVEPALLDDQMFSRELGLAPARDTKHREPGTGGVGGGFLDRASDLELNFEGQRSGGDLDLYSVIESIEPPPSAAETNRTGIEISDLALPSHHPRTTGSAGLPGLLGAQEDSASSDLLSSQWQMDSGLWDETATKLDLARAYIEMGDKESARGILQEVGGEGNEEQRAEAQELLRRVD